MIFAWDSFTDTNGVNLQAHTGEMATWTKHPNSEGTGNFVIDGNHIRGEADGSNFYYVNTTPPSADYDVEADFLFKSAPSVFHVGICGRMDPTATTFYSFTMSDDGVNAKLMKTVGGTETVLATNISISNADHRVKLQMRGTAIKVFVDGTQVASVTDSSITAAGRPGIVKYWDTDTTTSWHMDSFRAIVPEIGDMVLMLNANESSTDDTVGGTATVAASVGDLVVVWCGNDGGPTGPSGVTDSAGNTYVARSPIAKAVDAYNGRFFSTVVTTAITTSTTFEATVPGGGGTYNKFIVVAKSSGNWGPAFNSSAFDQFSAVVTTWTSGPHTLAAEGLIVTGLDAGSSATGKNLTPALGSWELADTVAAADLWYGCQWQIEPKSTVTATGTSAAAAGGSAYQTVSVSFTLPVPTPATVIDYSGHPRYLRSERSTVR